MVKDITAFEHNNATTLRAVAYMSFFWSASTLMIFSVLAAFLVDELKMKHAHIGIIEGLAISSSFLSKFLSGYLSDVFKTRKPLIMIGTVMSALTKPLFAICASSGLLFTARLADRLAKGIRSAPTDALIADLSERNFYATNFGFRQALYTLGQVFGAVIAMIVLLLSNNNYRLLFALASVPALISVVILWLFIRPHPDTHPRAKPQFQFKKIHFADFRNLSPTFWYLMLSFFFLMMARFSEAFLTLKAKEVGFSIAYLPLLVVIMDIVHAGIAWPSGKYADRISRKLMLSYGLVIMILAHVVLSFVTTVSGVILGIILLGLHMGMTQGLVKAFIAQSTPPELRGTAFSLFFIVSGIALFLGNAIAGQLSEQFGLHASFLGGGIFSALSMVVIFAVFMRKPTYANI